MMDFFSVSLDSAFLISVKKQSLMLSTQMSEYDFVSDLKCTGV